MQFAILDYVFYFRPANLIQACKFETSQLFRTKSDNAYVSNWNQDLIFVN
jgi:hypothetical protein